MLACAYNFGQQEVVREGCFGTQLVMAEVDDHAGESDAERHLVDLPSSGARDDCEDYGLRWLCVRLFSSPDLLIHEEYVRSFVLGESSDLAHFEVRLQFTSLGIPASVYLVLQGSFLAEERHDFEALRAAYEFYSAIGGEDEHLVQPAYPFDLSWLALHPVGCL